MIIKLRHLLSKVLRLYMATWQPYTLKTAKLKFSFEYIVT